MGGGLVTAECFPPLLEHAPTHRTSGTFLAMTLP
jgi:hypothetical protein